MIKIDGYKFSRARTCGNYRSTGIARLVNLGYPFPRDRALLNFKPSILIT